MTKRIARAIPTRNAVAAACLALIAGCSQSAADGKAKQGPPPAPVKTAAAQAKDMAIEQRGIGTVQPSSSVTIRSQISGILTKVSFTEGTDVAQGQVLASVDPRPAEQALKQAEANADKSRSGKLQAEANAARDEAQAANAELQARRYGDLLGQGVTTKEQVEQLRTAATAARASVDADRAAVETGKAAIAADEAAVENARLQLDYCSIRAPFAGRAGMLLVNEGNLLTAGATALVTINRLEPIYVVFSVPESDLQDLRSHQAQGRLEVEARPSASGGDWRRTGTIDVIDNQIDQTTGTIQLRAVFANADGVLWPGEFVDVVVRLGSQHGAISVPSQAVQTGQKGDYVFVVKADLTAEMRLVTVDRSISGETVIAKGLNAGETVVVDGLLRVSPGAKVQEARDGDAPRAENPAGDAPKRGDGSADNSRDGSKGGSKDGKQSGK